MLSAPTLLALLARCRCALPLLRAREVFSHHTYDVIIPPCADTALCCSRLQSHAEMSATYGAVGTGGAVILMLMLACGCLGCRRGASVCADGCDDGSKPRPGKKKSDHVV